MRKAIKVTFLAMEVSPLWPGEPGGLGIFRSDDLRDERYKVLGTFSYGFGDGSSEPCFLLMDPKDGTVLIKSCSRFRVREVQWNGEKMEICCNGPHIKPCGPTPNDMDCACGCSGDDTRCWTKK